MGRVAPVVRLDGENSGRMVLNASRCMFEVWEGELRVKTCWWTGVAKGFMQ